MYRGEHVYEVLYDFGEDATTLNDRNDTGSLRAGTASRDARAGNPRALKLAMIQIFLEDRSGRYDAD